MSKPSNGIEKDPYATPEDFQQIFARHMTDLFRLALLLTANPESAEDCLILSMKDCIDRSTVTNKWALIWARRMLIRNAIRLVLGTENEIANETEGDIHLQPSEYPIEVLRESVAILSLSPFERLAFVICVLERFSILDCALLLRTSPKDVQVALRRATNRVIPADEQSRVGETAIFRNWDYGRSCHDRGTEDRPCRGLLD